MKVVLEVLAGMEMLAVDFIRIVGQATELNIALTQVMRSTWPNVPDAQISFVLRVGRRNEMNIKGNDIKGVLLKVHVAKDLPQTDLTEDLLSAYRSIFPDDKVSATMVSM